MVLVWRKSPTEKNHRLLRPMFTCHTNCHREKLAFRLCHHRINIVFKNKKLKIRLKFNFFYVLKILIMSEENATKVESNDDETKNAILDKYRNLVKILCTILIS